MSRREELLAEMGLAPVWKLRQAGSSTEAAAVSAPAPALALAPAPAPAAPAAGGATREQRILQMDWTGLRSAVSGCTACKLRAGCTQTVFGVGDEQADWMIVGEAPGAEEDKLGEPFVGQAGRLLDSMLATLTLARDRNVYIANVLKCRPPGNRNPEPDEVAQCSPHLLRQIELVKPKLILAMGRFAVQSLLQTESSIASLRGRLHRYHGVPVVVTYHPAYLLRTLPDKAKAWADLVFARRSMSA